MVVPIDGGARSGGRQRACKCWVALLRAVYGEATKVGQLATCDREWSCKEKVDVLRAMGGSNIAAKEEGRCCEWLGVQLQRNGYVPANVTYEFLRRSSSATGLR
jgi:hypothetical protein